MVRSLRLLLLLVTTSLGLGTFSAAASAADTAFTSRFAKTVRGDIVAIGNASLTCPDSNASCANARSRTLPADQSNNYNMVNIDVDSDATTFNSSSATLTMPAGSTVEWAGLYWASDTSAGTGGGVAPDATKKGQVRVAVDGGAYQTVTAATADVLTSTPQPSRYRSFGDVTSLLPAAGSSTVTVANLQAGTGDDRFGGWALLVAYRNSGEAIRRLNAYDGLGTVNSSQAYSTSIGPFQTPATGAVTAKLGLVAFEGDAGLATESVSFSGSTLSDGLNPTNNVMNSTIATGGTNFTAKNPNYANQLGTDIDVLTTSGVLGNGQTSAPLAFTSTQDYFMPSAFFLVSDEGPAVSTSPPTIAGVARDGEVLTASPGSWNGTPTITYGYQWQRCDAAGANCADLPGETGRTLTLTGADVGSSMRAVVVASNDAGNSLPATSAATAAVAMEPPSNLTVPALSGTARDDETLTSTLGTWDGTGPLAYAYRWQRCDAAGANCVDIAGATSGTYVLTDADAGRRVRSAVRASNTAGAATAYSLPSSLVAALPPVNQTAPVVSGTPRDGETLTASDGTWTGTQPIIYGHQWQRCDAGGAGCADIAGATSVTYTLAAADVAGRIRVLVTATNAAGNAAEPSVPSAAVTEEPPANATPPSLSGTPRSGSTLTADPGQWTGTAVDLTYAWERCDAGGTSCVVIPGSTGSTYGLTDADVGHRVRSVVTGTNGAGQAQEATQLSGVIAALPPVARPAERPAIVGTVRDGSVLTADTGGWDGSRPMSFGHQWQRCDADGTNCVNIPGATDATYAPGPHDVGHAIRVTVTGTNSGGGSSATSGPSAPVAAAPPRPQPAQAEPAPLRQPLAETACQQLAGGAKYRRVKLPGLGDVRVRAYTSGPALRESPVLVSTTVVGGRARWVRYRLDGRALAAAGGARHPSTITPAQLGAVGDHLLTTTLRGRGKARTIKLRLRTVPCQTLFTAQRWRTKVGFGLRLRVDARSALDRLAFRVPRSLRPQQVGAARPAGFLRLYLAGRKRPVRFDLRLPARGSAAVLDARSGPSVRFSRRGLRVYGLPAGTAVAELTLYRVTRLDRATPRRALKMGVTVVRRAALTQIYTSRPRAPR